MPKGNVESEDAVKCRSLDLLLIKFNPHPSYLLNVPELKNFYSSSLPKRALMKNITCLL